MRLYETNEVRTKQKSRQSRTLWNKLTNDEVGQNRQQYHNYHIHDTVGLTGMRSRFFEEVLGVVNAIDVFLKSLNVD